VARLVTRKDNDSDRSKTPTGAVITLLSVYTAMYLAVVGIIHFTTSPDAAAAIAPEVTSTHVAVTTLPVEPFRGAGGLPATQRIDPETAGPDNSRECTAEIDADCFYN